MNICNSTYTNIKYEGNWNYSNANFYYIISEKTLSIMLHIFVMTCFEIYFYFNYIVLIEKKLFLKIKNIYFDKLNIFYIDETNNQEKIVFKKMFNNHFQNNNQELYLYHRYKESLNEQSMLNDKLYINAMIM